jgi:AcrR family transcriptional regulator
VTAVADAAGVSGQTVYNVFGTKAALLKVAYDITLAGDDADLPLAERPEVKALYEVNDAAQFLHGYAALGRTLMDRLAPLTLQVHAGAAAGEASLVALVESINGERLVGTGFAARRVDELGALSPGLSVDDARDRIWTLNSIEVWHLLVDLRGWNPQEYEHWVGDQMCAAVLAQFSAPTRKSGESLLSRA